MIAIIKSDVTHYIISCNTNHNPNSDTHELWISRPNGKNLKVSESKDQQEISLIKEAIDYGIENGEFAIRLADSKGV